MYWTVEALVCVSFAYLMVLLFLAHCGYLDSLNGFKDDGLMNVKSGFELRDFH